MILIIQKYFNMLNYVFFWDAKWRKLRVKDWEKHRINTANNAQNDLGKEKQLPYVYRNGLTRYTGNRLQG